MTDLDVDHTRSWIGRQEVPRDRVTRFPVMALSATLDGNDPPPRAGEPNGNAAALGARNSEGQLAMEAEATLAA